MATINVGMMKETAARFGADDASTHAAAIAYSAVFAIAPLLIVAIGIAGQVLGFARGGHQHSAVEDQLIGLIGSSMGSGTAQSVREIVDASFKSHQGSILAQVIGWATFLLAASGLFLALQNALNKIWHVEPKHAGIVLTIRNRLASAAMLLVIGIVILGTTLLNFVLSFLWDHFTAVLPFPGAGLVFSILNWVISVGVIAVLFAALYKLLPDTEVAWRDVVVGAVVTALLFVVGEALLGIYIAHAGISSAYGTAGSLVILLVWVYYSAMLLLFGAEFTRVYAEHHGSLASQQAAHDGDPATRGATGHTSEGSTVEAA